MSTRGAHSWVRITPTGLPDWTSRVSSPARSLQRCDDRVEARPAARRAARAAVHDELVGMLGHLGIEVVHQHPHGRFLRPAPAGQGGAARGADRPRAGWVGGRHRWLLVESATRQVAGRQAGAAGTAPDHHPWSPSNAKRRAGSTPEGESRPAP